MKSIVARAYCSSANLGPGFDVLAVALDAFYDEVRVEVRTSGSGIAFSAKGPYANRVPRDPDKNAVIAIARHILDEYLGETGKNISLSIDLWKGVPVSLGLGSSGASSAAIVVALNKLFDLGISVEEMIKIAGIGEKTVAGQPHYDNVAASILGGFVIIYSKEPLRVHSFHRDAVFVLGIPLISTQHGKTGIMRSILPRQVPLESLVDNTGRLAALLSGLLEKNYKLAGEGMIDYIVEPRRSRYIPCYNEIRRAALENGGLGVAISGAGPSLIILVENQEKGLELAEKIRSTYSRCGLESTVKLTRPAPGAIHLVR